MDGALMDGALTDGALTDGDPAGNMAGLRICLLCGRHGPPVSAGADHGPCGHCVAETGAPDWVPAERKGTEDGRG